MAISAFVSVSIAPVVSVNLVPHPVTLSRVLTMGVSMTVAPASVRKSVPMAV